MTRIGAGLSTTLDAAEAATEAAAEARAALTGEPDLTFVFLSPAHWEEAAEAFEAAEAALPSRHILGCVAEGVVARDRELEEGPGVAVWSASLPGARIEPFHLETIELDEGIGVTGMPPLQDADLVALLVDPFTFPASPLLTRLNEELPGLPLVGGIAAGGGQPGTQSLFCDGDLHEDGAVGAVLADVRVKTVVSQGCAPIGRDAVITRAEDNVVFELAGEPALERLRNEIAALTPEQQRQAASGLLAGLVIDENAPEYGRGDFLMRGLLGADESTGAIALGEPVRVGQTLRFHVRDAGSADEDLREALAEALSGGRAAGALLFTCNGRGTHMFSEPHHDARLLAEALGGSALAGFFCAGEIGPVGGRTFLHGFTATMAVFLDD